MSANIPTKYLEALDFLCRDYISSGMSREVYRSPLLPDCVVKVENVRGHFQNIVEWETWQRVKDTKYSRHFAPCLHISGNGLILIQQETHKPPKDFLWPEHMPKFLGDFKYSNYGLIFPPFHTSDREYDIENDVLIHKVSQKEAKQLMTKPEPKYTIHKLTKDKFVCNPVDEHSNTKVVQTERWRLVCHDYGTNLLFENGLTDKLKKADWWQG